jgi:NADH-quinone oxidoreductase subunit M
MILGWLIVIPAAGGLLCGLIGALRSAWSKYIALFVAAADLVLAVQLIFHPLPEQIRFSWIPPFGITVDLSCDGLSLVLVVLTAFLGLIATVAAWTQAEERSGFFFFNLLLTLAGVTGVFLSRDLFLFYFFWEVMLVPMYFLIALYGHENRFYASSKFFLFTQASGLLMLVAILALYFFHGEKTGEYTFNSAQLLGTSLSPAAARLILLGFLAAFLVKLPGVPFHSWLPDAYCEAPTAGSIILGGLLSKTGAYGLLRFVLPLLAGSGRDFAPIGMALGIATIVYGALQAFGQKNLKRMISYMSLSHLGFILLGTFAANRIALYGVIMQILSHGLSTGALFFLAGGLEERLNTLDIDRMGGLWRQAPRMGFALMLFAMASLGLPGLGNFIGEILVLVGVFKVSPLLAVLASTGLITSCVYSVWMVQKTLQGPKAQGGETIDLGARETVAMAAMSVLILWLGLFPQPVFTSVKPVVERLWQISGQRGPATQIEHKTLVSESGRRVSP